MNSAKGISIAALVCGVLGVVFSFFNHSGLVFVALVISIVGVVLGTMGMKKAKEANESSPLAIAGFVCGLVGMVFALIGVVCWISCYAAVCAARNNLSRWSSAFSTGLF